MQDSASIPKGDLWTELDKKKKENINVKKLIPPSYGLPIKTERYG